MSSAFSSISSYAVLPKKYDVFSAFEVRILAETSQAIFMIILRQKKVETFIDNNELKKRDDISPASHQSH